jgi:two-component system LytT family response regulator
MYRTVIVDDERADREILAKMLMDCCPEVEVLAKCSTLKDAQRAIYKSKPDLIFLDIEMPESTGFDLLMQLKEINFEIIFTTYYKQYARKAVRFGGLNFLLKPIESTDLTEAVRRAGHKIARYQHREKMDSLLTNIKYLNVEKKIALATLRGLEFVTIGNIIRCESDNAYTIFHMIDKSKIVVSKSLGEFEELLADYHFLRIHQSHLVNLRYVKNYSKGNGGTITMEDNSIVDVSRRRKEQLIRRLSLS